jgi:hypothetical protein
MPQTEQQAYHAFHTFPEVDTLGVIIALGDCWTYRVYEKESLRPSLSKSEREDSTFTSSTHSIATSKANTYAPLDKLFGNEGHVRLQDARSGQAL